MRRIAGPAHLSTCLLLAMASAAGGCASALNTFWFLPCENGWRVYGGVKLDAERFSEALQADKDEKSGGKPPSDLTATDAALAAVDLPFSFALDTLSLPITVSWLVFGDKTPPLYKWPGSEAKASQSPIEGDVASSRQQQNSSANPSIPNGSDAAALTKP
jgi:uncharacterized protein YceK